MVLRVFYYLLICNIFRSSGGITNLKDSSEVEIKPLRNRFSRLRKPTSNNNRARSSTKSRNVSSEESKIADTNNDETVVQDTKSVRCRFFGRGCDESSES